MKNQTQIPISLFKPLPFQDHPTGTVLLFPPQHQSDPRKLCIAIKIGGLLNGQTEIGAAVMVQGTPFGGEPESPGEVLRNIGAESQIFENPMLGLFCPTRVEIAPEIDCDFSQQRAWRGARGSLVIGSFGVRLCGRIGTHLSTLGVPISPSNWATDQAALHNTIEGLISAWTLVLELGAMNEVHIPVRATT